MSLAVNYLGKLTGMSLEITYTVLHFLKIINNDI
jgi:hypothetical protein